jgi:hypothetical protein
MDEFPAGAGNFSLRHRVQTGSGAHPSSYMRRKEVKREAIAARLKMRGAITPLSHTFSSVVLS